MHMYHCSKCFIFKNSALYEYRLEAAVLSVIEFNSLSTNHILESCFADLGDSTYIFGSRIIQ